MKRVLWTIAVVIVLAYVIAVLYQHRSFGDLQAEMASRLYHLKDWIVAEMEGLLRFIEHPGPR